MVPPVDKFPNSKLINSNETMENNFKVLPTNCDAKEKKQKSKAKLLSLTFLKDVWSHKKQKESTFPSNSSFDSTNGSETTMFRKNKLEDLNEISGLQSNKLLQSNHNVLYEDKEQEIQEVHSKHILNKTKTIENEDETNNGSHEKDSETNESTNLTDKTLDEQVIDREVNIKKLQEDLKVLHETNQELEQQVVDLIYSINCTDDSHVVFVLKKEILKRDNIIKESVEAGDIFLEEIENTKKLLKDIGKNIRINWARLKSRKHTLVDLFHISRSFISELSRQVIVSHNETKSYLQEFKEERLKYQNDISKERNLYDALKHKLDTQMKDSKAIIEDNSGLKEKIKNLEETINHLKEHLKETKNNYELHTTELKNEYSEKVNAAFEKQEFFQIQVNQTLKEKANMIDEMKIVQKENSSLLATNKLHEIKIISLTHELESMQEKLKLLEKELQQEQKTNSALQKKVEISASQIEGLERRCKENEYALADGEMWCLGMHHQDQAIVQELEMCLVEKENLINALRIQGECGKGDFEKLQAEVNLKKSKMEELKRLLADFEKNREQVVKDQKEFYTKMKVLHKSATLKERVCENLMKEIENKSKTILSLEEKLKITDNLITEINKQSQKEIKMLQSELKGAVERLREYEHHVEIMDRDFEMQLSVMQNNLDEEKSQKITTLEKVESSQNCIKEMKKNMEEICNQLQSCEKRKRKLEKVAEKYNKEKYLFQTTEEQLQDLKLKKMNAETKLQNALKDLENMSQSLDHNFKTISTLQKELQENKICLTESQNATEKTKQDMAVLQENIRTLTFEKEHLETKLIEVTNDRNFLQKDHEELCNKLIASVRMLMEAKLSYQQTETQVHKLKGTIMHLHKQKKNSEAGLKCLTEAVNQTHYAIKMLEIEKHKLCKEIEEYITQPEHTNDLKVRYESCVKNLNEQLLGAKEGARKMRHQHTQHFLHLQSDKQWLEEFIEHMNNEQSINAKNPL